MADNWLSDAWEWLVPGEDDQGIFKNIFGGDEDYESEFDDELLSDLGIDPNTPQNTWEEQLDALTDTIMPMPESQWTDDAGYEDWLANMLSGRGFSTTEDLYQSTMDEFTPDTGDEDLTFLQRMGVGEDYDTPQWLKVIGDILGVGGSKGGKRQGILGLAERGVGAVGGGIGSLLNSDLGQLAMLNYMKNKNKDYMDVPVGWGDGGGGGGEGGSPIDYRVFNLQPALMPGVAYANVGNDEPSIPPPGMKGGGLGDITLAKLEPGEFVVTKKAVDNVGAKNLYKMMQQWEGRG